VQLIAEVSVAQYSRRVEATTKELSWTGICIDRVSEGRIVESWANWDMLGMMQQLGIAQTPGQSEQASPT
jgi:hypothetical protein